MYSMRNNRHASGWRSHVFDAEQSTCKWMKKPYYSAEQSTCKWMKKPCILCRTIYMQVDEEAMHSMQNNIHASGWRSHVFYAEQSTCKWMKKPCILVEQSTCKWMKKPCILCGTVYMQVDEEAMYSMWNHLHASGWRSHVFYEEQSLHASEWRRYVFYAEQSTEYMASSFACM